eukprot:TRINITY_DN5849_c0_g1_i1.p1 TRINITY_DN5849_c0_g1~~TRINITY_DN5849_c0_g1_i1.p1  ORF type:complete len:538 (-),score=135.53 TRINITY_DN5849_c0_g1_i1:96-1709(-)
MGSAVSAIRGYEPDENAAAVDGTSNASPAASGIDPGALYFGTRLFVNPNNQQQDDAAGDEEAGHAAANGEGELGALEVLRRVNNTAPFHQTKTLNCPIYLKKTSLSLVPVSENAEEKQKPTKFGLKFVMDSCTSCAVTVFYACTEVYDKDNQTFKFVPVDEKGRPREDAAPPRRIIGEPGLQQTFTTRFGEELDVTKYPIEHLFQFYRSDESVASADNVDEKEGNENGNSEDADSELVSLNEVEDGEERSQRRSKRKDKKHKKDKKQKKRDKKGKKSRTGRAATAQDETQPNDASESASSIEISNEDPAAASSVGDDINESEDVELEEIPRKRVAIADEVAEEEEEEETEESPAIFPVVILIEPLLPSSSASAAVMPGFTVTPATRRVQGLATYATLIKTSESYEIKTLRQKLFFDGVPYVVHDIYGLDSDQGVQQECVICLTENRDTVVLPCRHMCLCHQCAEIMKADTLKCPICRGAVRALMKVEVSSADEDAKNNDSESTVKGSSDDSHEESEDGEEIELVKKPRQESTVANLV